MSNVAKVLKAEIARISKREVRSATQGIGKSNTWLKKLVADLRRRVFALERENRRLVVTMKNYQEEKPQKPNEEQGKKARLTSRGVHSLRRRLHLSQADFAKLLGTTPHAVYLWEKKKGALNLRERTKAAILSIRELRAKEVRAKLEGVGKKNKRSGGVVPKKRKRP